MILPAEIRLGADKRGKGRQEGKKEGGEEGARQGREARVPNCEVSHTWGGRAAALGRSVVAAAADDDDDDGDGDAVAAGENGWEIHFQPPDSNRVDRGQTRPDRGERPRRTFAIEKRSVIGQWNL